jgi:surface antigen
MKFRFVAPIVGLMLLTACASDSGPAGPGHAAAPIVPAAAALKSMDDADQAFMTEHFAKAMDNAMTGQATSWTNPSSGNQVQVTPTRTYQPANNRYCREFTQSISEKGQGPATRGTACQQSDGSWQIVS